MFTKHLPPYLMLNSPEAEPGTPAPTPPVPGPPPVAATPPVVTPPAAEPPLSERLRSDPEWGQREIERLRKEAGDHRAAAKTAAERATEQAQKDFADKLAVALGLKPDAAQDPAALTAALSDAQTKARDASLKLAVYQTAGTAGANPDALLDSNTFLANVRQLDPTSSDFPTKVSEAITAAVTANPTLKAARAAGASTVETPGGTGEQGQITEAQLAQMTPEQINDALEKGLLKNLLT
jgi:hypothetical protein